MADQREELVRKMVAEGTSDDDIRATLKVYDAQQAASAPQTPGLLDTFKQNLMDASPVAGLRKAATFAVSHPVQVGSMIGGIAAVPLTGGASVPAAMAAAGLGGAGGAALGSIANAAIGNPDGPKTAGDVAKTMAEQGAINALGEGVGQGAGRLLKVGGKLVYRTALRPSMRLQREFPNIVDQGLKEGLPVSDRGARITEGRLNASADTAKRLIADAEASGAPPVTTREVASDFGDVFKQGRNQAALGRPDPRPAVLERLRTFNAKHPNGIALGRAQELKQEAQDLASKAYRAEDLGHPLTDLSAASDRAMASGLRKGIEARVPDVAAVNEHSQQLIGLLRALEDANRRNIPGVGSIRSLLGDFIPSVSSAAGIGADRIANLPIPATLKAALVSALSGEQ